MYLGEILKQLPNSLIHLTLGLSYNKLGENLENMEFLGDGMK